MGIAAARVRDRSTLFLIPPPSPASSAHLSRRSAFFLVIVIFVLSGGNPSTAASFARRGILEMSGLNAGMGSASGDVLDAGFAKLHGKDFHYIMQSYEITVGRNTKKEKVDLDLSVVARDKDVSGRHARIFYDFQHHSFALEVLGQRGCYVRRVLHRPGDGPIKLKSQDVIQNFRLDTHNSTFSYQLAPSLQPLLLRALHTCLIFVANPFILVSPQLLLSTLIFHHNPCLHPARALSILIFLLRVTMVMAGPIVAMELLLALELKECLRCQSTCLLLNRTPIVCLSRLNQLEYLMNMPKN